MAGPPPHPGALWQQLVDRQSGFPYYWNTATNQVRWEVPVELVQYRQSVAPPPLPTNPPLPSGPAPASLPPISVPQPSLISAYDDSDPEEQDEKVAEQEPRKVAEQEPRKVEEPGKVEEHTKVAEEDPAFIGPVAPRARSQEEEETTDDILALLEKEKPPDYPVTPQQPSHFPAYGQGQAPQQGHFLAYSQGQVAQLSAPGPAPPQATVAPTPPVRRPQLGSMLQLACNYGHESESEEEGEEEGIVVKAVAAVKEKKRVVDGELDAQGRMVFSETREQREARERDRERARREEEERRGRVEEVVPSGGGGRRKRLALPGGRGRFNKADLVTEKKAEEEEALVQERMAKYMEYQNESPEPPKVAPDTPEKEDTPENGLEVAGPATTAEPPIALTEAEAVGEEAAELVEKLEFFKVGEEKVGTLKTLAIKLETLYTAWRSGALSLSYLCRHLATCRSLLGQAELGLVEPPWRADWDRALHTYTFSNSLTGQKEEPEQQEQKEASPPLPPPDEGERPPLPPPDHTATPPPPSGTPPPGYGDMEIEEEDQQAGLTDEMARERDEMARERDEMASFYSSLEPEEDPAPAPTIPPPSPPLAAWAERDPARSSPAPAPCTAGTSPASSAPNSPAPAEPKAKKRKKVKVSNNIALKKKGVGDMLAKWQKINS